VWALVRDEGKGGGYADKWKVDGEALVERLHSMSYMELLAVVDAVERFWQGSYRQEGPIGPRLREVGLIKGEGL
jgi:hypothetical protein